MGEVLPAPAFQALPERGGLSDEFLRLRALALQWVAPYYDGNHLTRAADWMGVLAPRGAEPLLLAALLHDMERSVPGGPVLDKENAPWDDRDYNRAHCDRSAEVVSIWLAEHGASETFLEGVKQPIREHEFGGSPEGDLMQAADSISFLEVNGPLVARWVAGGECTPEKGREKLQWMCHRVRLEGARATAAALLGPALAEVDRVSATRA